MLCICFVVVLTAEKVPLSQFWISDSLTSAQLPGDNPPGYGSRPKESMDINGLAQARIIAVSPDSNSKPAMLGV